MIWTSVTLYMIREWYNMHQYTGSIPAVLGLWATENLSHISFRRITSDYVGCRYIHRHIRVYFCFPVKSHESNIKHHWISILNFTKIHQYTTIFSHNGPRGREARHRSRSRGGGLDGQWISNHRGKSMESYRSPDRNMEHFIWLVVWSIF